MRDFGKGARRAGRGYAKASLAQVLCKCVATRNGIVVFGCRRKIATNLRAGGGRTHDVEPIARGLCSLIGQDFDTVAHGELVREWGDHAINHGADAMVADLGVDGIREIKRRRPRAQAHDLALGCKHENFLVKKIDLQ